MKNLSFEGRKAATEDDSHCKNLSDAEAWAKAGVEADDEA